MNLDSIEYRQTEVFGEMYELHFYFTKLLRPHVIIQISIALDFDK